MERNDRGTTCRTRRIMVEGAALCPPSAASTASDSSPATPAADGGIRIRTSCTRQQRRRAPSRHHLLLLLSLLLPLLLSFVSGQTLLQSDNQVMFWPDTIFVPVGGQIQFKIRWFHIPNGGDLQFIKAPAAVVDCQPDTFPGTVTIDQPFDQTCTLDPGMDTTPFIMTLNYPGSHQEIAVNFEDSGTKAWVSSPAWGGGFGTGGALPGYRDGVGSEALFNHVGQGALHSNGYLMYLPDVGNHAIRTLNLNTNEVRTIWGVNPASVQYASPVSNVNVGLPSSSNNPVPLIPDFFHPIAVALTRDDSTLYIADHSSCTIRKMSLTPPMAWVRITDPGSCQLVYGGAIPTITASIIPDPSALVLDETKTDGFSYLYILAFGSGRWVGASPVLVQMRLPDYVLTTMTEVTHPVSPPYHYDGTYDGMLGYRTSMALSNDGSKLILVSEATVPAATSTVVVPSVPSVVRYLELDSSPGRLHTALNWFYSPAQTQFGQVEDGFPDGKKPSAKGLIGRPSAMALSPDNRYMYFLDTGRVSRADFQKLYVDLTTYTNFDTAHWPFPVYCSDPGYVGADCDTTIRRMDLLTGEVKTLAGGRGNSDGIGKNAGIWAGSGISNRPLDSMDPGGRHDNQITAQNSLLMHPSGQHLYVLEGTSNSRVRKFDLSTYELKTVAGGGSSSDGARNIFGSRASASQSETLFSSPHSAVTSCDGRYVYVSDSFTITKIDTRTGNSWLVAQVTQEQMRQDWANTPPIGSGDEAPGFFVNNFAPLIADPERPDRVWAFQLISNRWQSNTVGTFHDPSQSTLVYIDSTSTPVMGNTTRIACNSGVCAAWAYNQYAGLVGSSRPTSGVFDMAGKEVMYVADWGANNNVGDTWSYSRLLRVRVYPDPVHTLLVDEVVELIRSSYLDSCCTTPPNFGALTGLVFAPGDTVSLYAIDVTYHQIHRFTVALDALATVPWTILIANPDTPLGLSVVGNALDGDIAGGTDGTIATEHDPHFQFEQRGLVDRDTFTGEPVSQFAAQLHHSVGEHTPDIPGSGLHQMVMDESGHLYFTSITRYQTATLRRMNVAAPRSLTTVAGGSFYAYSATPWFTNFYDWKAPSTSYTRMISPAPSLGGPGSNAAFTTARGMTRLPSGQILLLDTFHHHMRVVIPAGSTTPHITRVKPSRCLDPTATTIVLTLDGENLNAFGAGMSIEVMDANGALVQTVSMASGQFTLTRSDYVDCLPYKFRAYLTTSGSAKASLPTLNTFTWLNPSCPTWPTITSILPTYIDTGLPAPFISVTGTNFGESSDWDGAAVGEFASPDMSFYQHPDITYVSPTLLQFKPQVSGIMGGIGLVRLCPVGPTPCTYAINASQTIVAVATPPPPTITSVVPNLLVVGTGVPPMITIGMKNVGSTKADFKNISCLASATACHVLDVSIHPITSDVLIRCIFPLNLILGSCDLIVQRLDFATSLPVQITVEDGRVTQRVQNQMGLYDNAAYRLQMASRAPYTQMVESLEAFFMRTPLIAAAGNSYFLANDSTYNVALGAFPSASATEPTHSQALMPSIFGGPGFAFSFAMKALNLSGSVQPTNRVTLFRCGPPGENHTVPDGILIEYDVMSKAINITLGHANANDTDYYVTAAILSDAVNFVITVQSDLKVSLYTSASSTPTQQNAWTKTTSSDFPLAPANPTFGYYLDLKPRVCSIGADLTALQGSSADLPSGIGQVAFWTRAITALEVQEILTDFDPTGTLLKLQNIAVDGCGGVTNAGRLGINTTLLNGNPIRLHVQMSTAFSQYVNNTHTDIVTQLAVYPDKHGSTTLCRNVSWNGRCYGCDLYYSDLPKLTDMHFLLNYSGTIYNLGHGDPAANFALETGVTPDALVNGDAAATWKMTGAPSASMDGLSTPSWSQTNAFGGAMEFRALNKTSISLLDPASNFPTSAPVLPAKMFDPTAQNGWSWYLWLQLRASTPHQMLLEVWDQSNGAAVNMSGFTLRTVLGYDFQRWSIPPPGNPTVVPDVDPAATGNDRISQKVALVFDVWTAGGNGSVQTFTPSLNVGQWFSLSYTHHANGTRRLFMNGQDIKIQTVNTSSSVSPAFSYNPPLVRAGSARFGCQNNNISLAGLTPIKATGVEMGYNGAMNCFEGRLGYLAYFDRYLSYGELNLVSQFIPPGFPQPSSMLAVGFPAILPAFAISPSSDHAFLPPYAGLRTGWSFNPGDVTWTDHASMPLVFTLGMAWPGITTAPIAHAQASLKAWTFLLQLGSFQLLSDLEVRTYGLARTITIASTTGTQPAQPSQVCIAVLPSEFVLGTRNLASILLHTQDIGGTGLSKRPTNVNWMDRQTFALQDEALPAYNGVSAWNYVLVGAGKQFNSAFGASQYVVNANPLDMLSWGSAGAGGPLALDFSRPSATGSFSFSLWMIQHHELPPGLSSITNPSCVFDINTADGLNSIFLGLSYNAYTSSDPQQTTIQNVHMIVYSKGLVVSNIAVPSAMIPYTWISISGSCSLAAGCNLYLDGILIGSSPLLEFNFVDRNYARLLGCGTNLQGGVAVTGRSTTSVRATLASFYWWMDHAIDQNDALLLRFAPPPNVDRSGQHAGLGDPLSYLHASSSTYYPLTTPTGVVDYEANLCFGPNACARFPGAQYLNLSANVPAGSTFPNGQAFYPLLNRSTNTGGGALNQNLVNVSSSVYSVSVYVKFAVPQADQKMIVFAFQSNEPAYLEENVYLVYDGANAAGRIFRFSMKESDDAHCSSSTEPATLPLVPERWYAVVVRVWPGGNSLTVNNVTFSGTAGCAPPTGYPFLLAYLGSQPRPATGNPLLPPFIGWMSHFAIYNNRNLTDSEVSTHAQPILVGSRLNIVTPESRSVSLSNNITIGGSYEALWCGGNDIESIGYGPNIVGTLSPCVQFGFLNTTSLWCVINPNLLILGSTVYFQVTFTHSRTDPAHVAADQTNNLLGGQIGGAGVGSGSTKLVVQLNSYPFGWTYTSDVTKVQVRAVLEGGSVSSGRVQLPTSWFNGVYSTTDSISPSFTPAVRNYVYKMPYLYGIAALTITFTTPASVASYQDGASRFPAGLVDSATFEGYAVPAPTGNAPTISVITFDSSINGQFNITVQRLPPDVYNVTLSFSQGTPDAPTPLSTVQQSRVAFSSPFIRTLFVYNLTLPPTATVFELRVNYVGNGPFSGASLQRLSDGSLLLPIALDGVGNSSALLPLPFDVTDVKLVINATEGEVYQYTFRRLPGDIRGLAAVATPYPDIPASYGSPYIDSQALSFTSQFSPCISNATMSVPSYRGVLLMQLNFTTNNSITSVTGYIGSDPIQSGVFFPVTLLSGANALTVSSSLDGDCEVNVYHTPNVYISFSIVFRAVISFFILGTTPAWGSQPAVYPSLTSFGYITLTTGFTEAQFVRNSTNVPVGYVTQFLRYQIDSMTSNVGNGTLSLDGNIIAVYSGGRFPSSGYFRFPITPSLVPGRYVTLRIDTMEDGARSVTYPLLPPVIGGIAWYSPWYQANLNSSNSLALAAAGPLTRTGFFTYGGTNTSYQLTVPYAVSTIQLVLTKLDGNASAAVFCGGALDCWLDVGMTNAAFLNYESRGAIAMMTKVSISPVQNLTAGPTPNAPFANNFSLYVPLDGYYNYVILRRGPDLRNFSVQFQSRAGAAYTYIGRTTPSLFTPGSTTAFTFNDSLPFVVAQVRFSIYFLRAGASYLVTSGLDASTANVSFSNQNDPSDTAVYTPWFDLAVGLTTFDIYSLAEGHLSVSFRRNGTIFSGLEIDGGSAGGYGAVPPLPVSLVVQAKDISVGLGNGVGTPGWQPVNATQTYRVDVPFSIANLIWNVTFVSISPLQLSGGGSNVTLTSGAYTSPSPLVASSTTPNTIDLILTGDGSRFRFLVYRRNALVRGYNVSYWQEDAYTSDGLLKGGFWNGSLSLHPPLSILASASPWQFQSPVWNETLYDHVVFVPFRATYAQVAFNMVGYDAGSVVNATWFGPLSAPVISNVSTRIVPQTYIQNLRIGNGVNQLLVNTLNDGLHRIAIVRRSPDVVSLGIIASTDQNVSNSAAIILNTNFVFTPGQTGVPYNCTVFLPLGPNSTNSDVIPVTLFVTLQYSRQNSITSIVWNHSVTVTQSGADRTTLDSRDVDWVNAFNAGVYGQAAINYYSTYPITSPGTSYTDSIGFSLNATIVEQIIPLTVASSVDGNYTIYVRVVRESIPDMSSTGGPPPLPPIVGYFTILKSFSTLYTGEIATVITVVARRAPTSQDGLTLQLDSSAGPASLSTSFLFFPSTGQPGTINTTFTLNPILTPQQLTITFTTVMPVNVSANVDIFNFIALDPLVIPILPYPPFSYGVPNATMCPCNPNPNSGSCDVGPYATGQCTCQPHFVAPNCTACMPGYSGLDCLPCSCLNNGTCANDITTLVSSCHCPPRFGGVHCEGCANSTFWGPTCSGVCPPCSPLTGRCDSGINGTGACLCFSGWNGPLCDQPIPGALIVYPGTFYGLDTSGGIVVEFNASATVFSARILTLPALGTLYQTADGKTASSPILGVPTAVTNAQNRVIYFPPTTIDFASLLIVPFTSFFFQVVTPLYTAPSASSTNSIILLHTNSPPSFTYTLLPTGTLYDRPASGLVEEEPAVVCQQAGRVALGVGGSPMNPTVLTQIQDTDAAQGNVTLQISASIGLLSFDSSLLPSTALTPTAQSHVQSYLATIASAYIAPNRAITLSAPLPLLNGLLSVLVYTPRDPLFYGADVLTFFVDDGGNTGLSKNGLMTGPQAVASALQDTRYLNVRTEQINQPIHITASYRFQVVQANGAVQGVSSFGGFIPAFLTAGDPSIILNISLSDVDAYFGAVLVRISLTSSDSTLSLPLLPSGGPDSAAYAQLVMSFTQGSGYSGQSFTTPIARQLPKDHSLEFMAPLATLNAVLGKVVYTPGGTANGTEQLTIFVSDQGNTCSQPPCSATTDTKTLSFTIPHREYPAQVFSSTVNLLEGSSKNVVELPMIDPNANAGVSILEYRITSVALQNVNAANGGATKQNFGGVGLVNRYAYNANTGMVQYGTKVFPSYTAAALRAFAPIIVTPSVLVHLAPFYFGTAILSFNFTVIKRVLSPVFALPAVSNGTITINVVHVNHPPYITNSAGKTSLSAITPIVFSQDFFATTDTTITLVGADFDAGDAAQLKYWISALTSKGKIFQFDDAMHDALVANQIPANSSLRGAEITRTGTEVSSRFHSVIYAAPTTDPTILAIQTNASANPTAYNGYVFPLYTSFDYYLTDPGGLRSGAAGQIQLHQGLPIIPIVPANLSFTASQDTDVLLAFQPVGGQSYSLNFSAITIYSLPTRGQLWTRDASQSLKVAGLGNSRAQQITSLPFTVYAQDGVTGDPAIYLLYAPPYNEYGPTFASFTYDVVGARGLRSVTKGMCIINLLHVNHAPISRTVTYSSVLTGTEVLPIDGNPNILVLNGTDVDGDPLIAKILTLPRNGTLWQMNADDSVGLQITTPGTVVNDSQYRVKYLTNDAPIVQPLWDFFLYTVKDQTTSSAPTQVSLLVGAATLPPRAYNTSATAIELDTVGVAVTLSGSDPKGVGQIGAYITRLPVYGSLRQLLGALVGVGFPVLSASSLSSRRIIYVPSTSRGFGPSYDSFGFKTRDSTGLSSLEEANADISIIHVYEPAGLLGASLVSRWRFEQDSVANRIVLNVSLHDSTTLGVVILSLPASGGALHACSSTSSSRGVLINSTMLPYIARAGGCPNTTFYTPGTPAGAVTVFYTPPPRAHGDPSVNNGIWESFQWAAYDNSTFRQLFISTPASSRGLTTQQIQDKISASPPVARVDLAVDFVSYPPVAYSANYTTTGLNGNLLLILSGVDTKNNLPVRAVVNSLPPTGFLFQYDDATSLPTSEITIQGAGVTSPTGRVVFQPQFNHFSVESFDFFVLVFPTTADAELAVLETPSFSSLDPRASNMATVKINVRPFVLPPLISRTPLKVTLEQNARSLIQIPILSFDAAQSASASVLITSLPSVGDVYQVRDSPGLDYTVWVHQQRQAVLSAGGAKRRLLDTLLDSQETTTALDGSIVELTDLNLATYPAISSWTYNPSSGSILPPVAYSASSTGATGLVGATLQVQQNFPFADADLMRVDQLPLKISHPSALLLYVPRQRQLGTDSIGYTLRLPPNASNPRIPPTVSGVIGVEVTKIFLPPIAVSFDVLADENLPLTVLLLATNGNDGTTNGITVVLESTAAAGGTICQLTATSPTTPSTVFFDRPCGEEYGESMAKGVPVLDGLLRVVYLPPRNVFGQAVDSFSYRVDSRDTLTQKLYSAVGVVTVSVTHINQPPMARNLSVVFVPPEQFHSAVDGSRGIGVTDPTAPGVAPSLSSPPSISTLYPSSSYTFPTDTNSSISLQLVDPDPEDTPDTLRYYVWRVRGSKGLISSQVVIPATGKLKSVLLYDFTLPRDTAQLIDYSVQRSYIFASPVELGFLGQRDVFPGLTTTTGSFAPPYLTYIPGSTGGALGSTVKDDAAAFLFVDYFVVDRAGLRSQNATISFRMDCGTSRVSTATVALKSANTNATSIVVLPDGTGGSVPQLWSNQGSQCAVCPDGGTCAEDGTFYPFSQDGYWRSDRFDQSGYPESGDHTLIYLACNPSTACLSTPFFLATNTSADEDAGGLPCAAGFADRMCAGCLKNYYFKDGECQQCSDTKNSVVQVIIVGIPVAVAAILFFVLLVKLRLDFTWIGVTADTFMLIGTLKHFALHWPVASSSMFSAFGVLLVNLDFLQLECQIPSVLYQQKWYLLMLLPLVINTVVIFFGYIFILVWTALTYANEPKRVQKLLDVEHAKALSALAVSSSPAKHEISKTGRDSSNSTAASSLIGAGKSSRNSIVGGQKTGTTTPRSKAVSTAVPSMSRMERRLSLKAMRSNEQAAFATNTHMSSSDLMKLALIRQHSFGEVWKECATVGQNFIAKVCILVLKALYLTISIKAQEPLKCTTLADGSRVLDVQLSLSCDEPWYRTMYPIAVLASIVYAVGIPLLFTYILFLTRPLSPETRRLGRFLRVPVRWRQQWRDQAVKEQVEWRRRNAAAAGQKELDVMEAVGEWNSTYDSLTEDFSKQAFYWSVVRCLRLLSLSVIAIWIGQSPLYQAVAALLMLWVSLLIQVWIRPYKAGTKVNQLEAVGLMALIGIIFCGLLLYTKQEDYEAGYSWVPLGLDYLITAFTGCVGLAVLSMLNNHMQRFGFYRKWRICCGCERKQVHDTEKDASKDLYSGDSPLPGEVDLIPSKPGRWFSAPAPATEVERRKRMLGWIPTVPGLGHLAATENFAGASAVAGRGGRRPSLVGPVVSPPPDMRRYLDPNYKPVTHRPPKPKTAPPPPPVVVVTPDSDSEVEVTPVVSREPTPEPDAPKQQLVALLQSHVTARKEKGDKHFFLEDTGEVLSPRGRETRRVTTADILLAQAHGVHEYYKGAPETVLTARGAPPTNVYQVAKVVKAPEFAVRRASITLPSPPPVAPSYDSRSETPESIVAAPAPVAAPIAHPAPVAMPLTARSARVDPPARLIQPVARRASVVSPKEYSAAAAAAAKPSVAPPATALSPLSTRVRQGVMTAIGAKKPSAAAAAPTVRPTLASAAQRGQPMLPLRDSTPPPAARTPARHQTPPAAAIAADDDMNQIRLSVRDDRVSPVQSKSISPPQQQQAEVRPVPAQRMFTFGQSKRLEQQQQQMMMGLGAVQRSDGGSDDESPRDRARDVPLHSQTATPQPTAFQFGIDSDDDDERDVIHFIPDDVVANSHAVTISSSPSQPTGPRSPSQFQSPSSSSIAPAASSSAATPIARNKMQAWGV